LCAGSGSGESPIEAFGDVLQEKARKKQEKLQKAA